jgi:hypothetical protein
VVAELEVTLGDVEHPLGGHVEELGVRVDDRS